MRRSENELVESLGFMASLTFVGGYLDAYTYVMRGGVFANNMTANIAKFGIELYSGNWNAVLDVLYPMLATIAGAFCAEHIKNRKYSGNASSWRHVILMVELAALFLAGMIPTTVPHVFVNLTVSFFAAWQLSSFRKFEGWIHNTTISTGNLRSLGQYAYQAIVMERNKAFSLKTLRYALLVASFAIGALAGTALCALLNIRAIWLCCAILAALVLLHASAPRGNS